MKIKPTGDKLLIKVSETEDVTASGIVLPDSVKERRQKESLPSIGTGEEVQKLGLQIDDVVLFGKYSGDEVELDGVEYKIINSEEILATIK